jgi:hypothetical protein
MAQPVSEEGIRRAYEEARFDERTPDERGFGELFEREIKPKLISGIRFNLDVSAARARRRFTAGALFVLCTLVFFVLNAFFKSSDQEGEAVFLLSVFGWIIAATSLLKYATKKRLSEEDPNNAIVIGALAARFGCRVGSGFSEHMPLPLAAPITPSYTDFTFVNEHLTGTFDEHVSFVALRLKMESDLSNNKITTFKGWYLNVTLPFAFSGTTVAYARASASHRLPGGRDLEVVALESPDFSKRFIVRSDSQVEARIIFSPDVMHHLTREADRFNLERKGPNSAGHLMLGFSGKQAHVWMPSHETALSVWKPLDPKAMIEGLHGAFEELAKMRAFLRDIDVIAESEGFRAQAARNGRGGTS